MELRPKMNLLPVSISLLVLLVSLVSSLPVTSRPSQHKRNALLEGRNCTRSTPVTGEESSSQSNGTVTTDEAASTQTICKTLKQLLHDNYRGGTQGFSVNSLFPFFVYHEMQFDHEDFDSMRSSFARQRQKANCESLTDQLNSTVPKRSICSWEYSCTYDPDQFPALDIQVTKCGKRENSEGLKIPNKVRNNVRCTELTQRIQYARRVNGCWKTAIKTVITGCECVMKVQ